jgi:hypothetical protein
MSPCSDFACFNFSVAYIADAELPAEASQMLCHIIAPLYVVCWHVDKFGLDDPAVESRLSSNRLTAPGMRLKLAADAPRATIHSGMETVQWGKVVDDNNMRTDLQGQWRVSES